MCVGITAALPTLPATPRGTERLRTCPRSRSSDGGWARAASLCARSLRPVQTFGSPGGQGHGQGAWGHCPRKQLWAEAGAMAAGSGGRADAPAPGVLGFSCLEPRIPQHMLFPRPTLFPAPSSGLAELPPLEEDGPEHPAGIRPRTPHPPLAARTSGYRARSPTVDGFRPAPPAPGAWGAHWVNAGVNEHALCQVPATRFPPDAAGRSLSGATEGERGTELGPWGWEERAGWGVRAPHPLLLGPARPLGRVTAAPAWGQAGDPARPACWLLRPQHV